MTTPTSKRDREEDVERIGGHELDGDRAERAGDAGVQGRDAEGQRLHHRSIDAHRLRGNGLIPDRDHRPADPAAQQVPAENEEDNDPEQREEVEPLILVQSAPCGRVGLDDDDAHRAAGPLGERLVLEDLRHRHAERERRQREVEAFEAQRRQAEQEAGDEADRAGDRNRRPVGHAGLVHQDRRGVGADGVERAVAERDLAVVAGQHVEAEQRDRVRQDQRHLEHAVVGERERQRAGERPAAARRRSACDCAAASLIPAPRGPCRTFPTGGRRARRRSRPAPASA